MAKKYITLEEAADRLGLSADELSAVREQGQIRGFADQGSWKFLETDIEGQLLDNVSHHRLAPRQVGTALTQACVVPCKLSTAQGTAATAIHRRNGCSRRDPSGGTHRRQLRYIFDLIRAGLTSFGTGGPRRSARSSVGT